MRRIDLFKVHMPKSVFKPLKQVLQSGFIGQGPKVEEFEAKLREYFKWEYINTTNNCTSSLLLALRLAGVKPGDEVITTPLTCTATNWPILALGAKIVWADVNPVTCNIDIDSVLSKITDRTKAIMFVHWGGYPVDVDALSSRVISFTGGRNIPLIEDCAHALGATLHGQFVGTFGNLSCFSLQAIKHITTVDGGLLFTSKELYKHAKLLRWYGIDREEKRTGDFRCEVDVPEWGYKAHMSDVSAVIGIEQMKYLDKILHKHRVNAQYYNKQLTSIPGIKLLQELPGSEPSYWLYTCLVENRTGFSTKMKEYGVVCSKVHERNDIHSCVKDSKSSLPLLDSINDRIVSIPVGWWVTKEDREYIVDCIRKGW